MTMLLEQNGRSSSSKRTKHIKSRYFFIQDKIADGDLEVEHCPTERMWADVLNKPKQGKVFREFRAALMNCPVDYVDVAQMAASPKKRCDVPPQCRSPKTITWDQAGSQKQTAKAVTPSCLHRRSVLGDIANGNRQNIRNRRYLDRRTSQPHDT